MPSTLSKQVKLNLRRKVPWVKGVLSAIVLFAAGFVAYKISQTKLDVSFLISGTNLSVLDKGEVIQILSLDKRGEQALSDCSHDTPFIIDKDVNFDGLNDVALLVSSGYGGVNCYYDYYIYNAQYKKLEHSVALENLSNPTFKYLSNKIINSYYLLGGEWYHEDFTWNGATYESGTRRAIPLPLIPYYLSETKRAIPLPLKKMDVSFLISGTNLSVVDKGEVIQILSLNEEAEWALSEGLCSHSPSFIIDKDVNFDGFNDVALLAATGYGGVNCSYDYYIYNAQYKKLEKSLVLEKLSHPEFNELTNKIINSRYKSAGYWYHEDFTWNGITYESVTRREFPLPLLQNSE